MWIIYEFSTAFNTLHKKLESKKEKEKKEKKWETEWLLPDEQLHHLQLSNGQKNKYDDDDAEDDINDKIPTTTKLLYWTLHFRGLSELFYEANRILKSQPKSFCLPIQSVNIVMDY